MSQQNEDVEVGNALLETLGAAAVAFEFARFKWDFVRVVYSFLAAKLLLAFGFAALVVNAPSVATFFKGTFGLIIYILAIFLACIVLSFLIAFRNYPPVNFILMGIYTVFYGFVVGFAASFTKAQLLAEALLALVVVLVVLFLYTFWPEKRDHEGFSFFLPFSISLLITGLTFFIFQHFYPTEKVTDTIYCGAVVVILSAYIILDTNSLLGRVPYNEFIYASISLSYFDAFRPLVIAYGWVRQQLLNILRASSGE